MSEAWVTLATNDTYALGAMVLANSLKRVQTAKKLHCLVTTGVSSGMKDHLNEVFDAVTTVNVLDSEDAENLALIGRPDLGVTFTKLHCWRLTQYSKCVFLDADTLVLQNSDELFEYEELSAAPDIGWPDIFNSGVFVFRPSVETYRGLIQTSLSEGSFDGGDQGLLNAHFRDWRQAGASQRLSFVYNMSSSAVYTYTAAYKRFGKDVKIVHFLGAVKPWHHTWGPGGLHMKGDAMHHIAHTQYWWSVFVEDVHPRIDPKYSSLIGGKDAATFSTAPLSDADHRRAVEAGKVDYMGRDSWDNIQKRLDQKLGIN
jgi:glycogenin glucosyltransferase